MGENTGYVVNQKKILEDRVIEYYAILNLTNTTLKTNTQLKQMSIKNNFHVKMNKGITHLFHY